MVFYHVINSTLTFDVLPETQARVVVGSTVVVNKVEQWSQLEQRIIARLPLFHCITVVVQVEVLVEFVALVSTHHVCYCWYTEEGVSGPVHLHLRQAMNAKHKVYERNNFISLAVVSCQSLSAFCSCHCAAYLLVSVATVF